MFCTVSQGKNKFLTATAPPGEEVWNFATLTSSHPWFFVSYSLRVAEEWVDESALLSLLRDLIGLLDSDEGHIVVQTVMLVTHSDINGSGAWKMERLKAVWKGKDQKKDSPVIIYQLADGRRYFSPSAVEESGDLTDLTCVVNM